MSELISGKNVILFFRERAKHDKEDGSRLKFQTEHSLSKEKESDTTITKDGPMTTIADGESSFDISSLAYKDDNGTLTVWENLEDCFDRGALMELWEVDISGVSDSQLKVKPVYYQGYFTSFEKNAPAEGKVELSFSFTINGKGVKGEETLTSEQLAVIKKTMYEYQTIKKTSEA
jgi:TP901-1 family phage major tail protein